MPHPPLQSGQGHPAADHIRPERVSHPMGIGISDSTAHSMMAESGAEASCRHRLTTLAAFERNEQGGRVGQRTFQAQIESEDFPEIRGQGHDAFLVAFAVDAHLAVGELQVFQFQG